MGKAAWVIFQPGGEGFPIIVLVMLAFVGWLGKNISTIVENPRIALLIQTTVIITGVMIVVKAASGLLQVFFTTAGYK